MTARSIAYSLTVAALLGGLLASPSRAQGPIASEFNDLYAGHDLQFFRPVDLDFDGRPIGRSSGFYFGYEKLSWSFTGERTLIGTTNAQQASQNPYRFFDEGGNLLPGPDDDPIVVPGTEVEIPPFARISGITSAPPSSVFAWGDRYEFGHLQDGDGWIVSILEGPEAVSNEFYGFGFTGQDGTTTTAPLGLPSQFPGAPNQLLSPLGSVYIAFNIPVLSDRGTADPSDDITLMHGFLDVDRELLDDDASEGGALRLDDNGDGVLDGDGFADDIDRDGQHGPDGFDTEDPAHEPDADFLGGTNADFDDLVLLPTAFQSVQVINRMETDGIEIMKTYRLPNRYRMAKHQNNNIDVKYGVRYLRMNDNFGVFGEGGTLGSSFWDTTIENHIVGPQIAVNYTHQRGKFLWDWNGRFLFGYNVQNWEQEYGIGEDVIPGGHNHSLYLDPTYGNHGRQDNEFSPVAEMRVQLSYQLTNALALKLGYNAILVDNIRRAAQQVDYTLPNMGFIDGGTSEIFINGASFGFEALY